MQKRVFVIHGWGGSAREGWRPPLKEQLESKGFIVSNLSMPNTGYPKIIEWLAALKKAVGKPDKNCYFIGHSLGCITILRYLETLNQGEKVGGALLTASFTEDLGIEEIKNFFTQKIDWEKIKRHCDNFIILLSDNDHYVDISYGDIFKEKLNAKIIIKHNLGHFNGDNVAHELPAVLDAFLKLVN